MSLLLTMLLPLSLLIVGLWILKIAKIKTSGLCELLGFSYTIDLALIFGILYIGSIFGAFEIASIIVMALTFIALFHLSLSFATKISRSPLSLKTSFLGWISREKLIVISAAIGLLLVFAVFLSSRAILDSDVAQGYLPIAREIVKTNGFTYSTGYDYNVLLKPIGASVLYAWTYAVSGSTFSESFRLLPLVPLLVLIALTYKIASFVTKSKTVGIISTAIFLVLPFNDRFLLYNAFYPDMFYYPLIFSVTYFLIKFFQTKQNSLLFWAGVGLGIAGLLKAQAIYVFIAFFVTLVALELQQFKKLSATLFILASLYILIPSVLANSIQSSGFYFYFPTLTETQWILLAFLSTFNGICFYIAFRQTLLDIKNTVYNITSNLFKKIVLILVPFVSFSSLWYFNNLFRFGTLIWTSSVNLPNYQWALTTLQSVGTIQPMADLPHYLAYFLFMFADPAVMGYVFLIPFLTGMFFFWKKKLATFREFMIFEIVLATVILSEVVLSLPSALGYNPRDIFVLAPLFATACAFGILSTVSYFRKRVNDSVVILVSLALVAFFGSLSYIHSVFVQFVSAFQDTFTGGLTSSLANIVGLNLTQTSLQISIGARATFIGDNIIRFALLSLICGTPLIFLLILRSKRLPTNALKHDLQNIRKRRINFAETFILIALILIVIIVPRADLFLAQGGFQGIQENQLEWSYQDLLGLITNYRNVTLNGDILSYGYPDGLPYYLSDVKIIDLSFPANLGYLKDCLLLSSTYETVTKLTQLGIHYLLIKPSTIGRLDTSLNQSISKIMQNPEFSLLSQKFGSWELFTLGPYRVEKTLVPLSGWSVYPQLTTAPYILNSNVSQILLSLNASDVNSRVTIFTSSMPKLNMSSFDYINVQLQGTSNARFFLRFFLTDGTSFDVSYWNDVYTITNTPFDLEPYASKTLRGDVYISIKSADGLPSSIDISEISLVKIIG